MQHGFVSTTSLEYTTLTLIIIHAGSFLLSDVVIHMLYILIVSTATVPHKTSKPKLLIIHLNYITYSKSDLNQFFFEELNDF